MTRKEELKQLLPPTFNGWNTISDKYFNPESLYDYIDGGAELYRSYDFKDVISRTYKNINEEEIIVELFDMQKTENAYGVFTQQREEESNEISQECQVILGSIIFWKGRYFVSLMNHKETPEIKKAMYELAKAISGAISEEGNKPTVIQRLPEKKLIKTSIRFFKHYIWLNSYNFISSENILNINSNNTAVLAKYEFSVPKPIMLVVGYKDEGSKRDAWIKLSNQYKFRSKEKRVALRDRENNAYIGFMTDSDTIFAVFYAASENDINLLLPK